MKGKWILVIGLILLLTTGCTALQENPEMLVKSQAEAFLTALDTMPADLFDNLPAESSMVEQKAAVEQYNKEIVGHFQPVMTTEGLKNAAANRWLMPKGLEMFLQIPVVEFTPESREITNCNQLSDGSWDVTVVCKGQKRQIRILLNLKQEDGVWKVASMRCR